MDDGLVVITGAATGIGRRAAVELAAAGRHVVVVTRSHERAASVVDRGTAAARGGGKVTSVPADLAELAQVRRAVERIAALGPVHAIVNNAAVLAVARRRPRVTIDGIEEVFAVNHVAPFVLTTGLLDQLTDRSRVIVAGSKGLMALPRLRLDPGDLDSRRRWSPTRAYYRSKIAQLMFTAELRRHGVVATALRVPSVRLDEERLEGYQPLVRLAYRPKQRFATAPGVIARCYVELVSGGDPGHGHVDERGRPVRWPNGSGDPELAAQLWDATVRLAAAHRGGIADPGAVEDERGKRDRGPGSTP